MKIQTVARGPVRVADGYTARLLKTWPMSAAGSFMFERKEIPAELTS
jgi:hypothetical protein